MTHMKTLIGITSMLLVYAGAMIYMCGDHTLYGKAVLITATGAIIGLMWIIRYDSNSKTTKP